MFLFIDNMGHSSNNETTFRTLETIFVIASSQGLSKLIEEGDY